MPRKKLIKTSDFPYHITTRSNNREWFQLPIPEVWSYCLKSLAYAHEKVPVKFHSFVLMSNHYHLLVSTPNANIDQFMYFFNKHLADQLRVYSKRINRVFGGPYSWCLTDREILRWLSEIPPSRENSFIQKGLRKSTFALAKDSNTGKEYQTSSIPMLKT